MSVSGRVKLSIVIANYNRLDWLKKCLGALEAQTPAFLDRFEVVLVDDGSAPEVVDFIKAYRAPYAFTAIFQKNRGPAVARNQGTRAAKGAYIAYIDNDSVAPPEWIERAFEAMALIKDGVVGVTGTIVPYPDPSLYNELTEIMESVHVPNPLKDRIDPFPHANTNNIIYARQPVLDVGIFDESYPYPAFEDTDMGFRLRKRGFRFTAYPAMRIFHPNEMDWKTLRKKHLMHGISIRKFCLRYAFKYPFSVIWLIALNFRPLVHYPLAAPFRLLSRKISEQKVRFLRSFYILEGFLGRKVAFKSKNS